MKESGQTSTINLKAGTVHQFVSGMTSMLLSYYYPHCRVGPIKLVLELETPRYMGFLGNRDSETFHFCQCFAGTHITQAI